MQQAAPYTISAMKPGSAAALSGMLAVNDLIHAIGNESGLLSAVCCAAGPAMAMTIVAS